MKGPRSRRLALSITSVLLAVAGLFVSMAIYASNLIWPDQNVDQYDLTYTDLPAEFDEVIPPSSVSTSSVVPAVVTTLPQPKAPDPRAFAPQWVSSPVLDMPAVPSATAIGTYALGPALSPDNDRADPKPARMSRTTSPQHDQASGGYDELSVYSLGTLAEETGPELDNDPVAGVAAAARTLSDQDQEDADYQLDMLIAALAEPIDRSIPPPPPVEVFALASDTPLPSPHAVFAVSEPVIWPQRVDHGAVLAVSQSLSAPDLAAPPAFVSTIGHLQAQPAPAQMAAPDVRLTAGIENLNRVPPEAVTPNGDDELVLQIARVLAARPVPIPRTDGDVAPVSSPSAPSASLRPPTRRGTDPTPPAPAEPVIEAPVPPIAIPAAAPVATSLRADDGRDRMSVIGVYKTDAGAWALLEFSDGRILKATKGTSFDDLKVVRITDDKIWIRDGGMEKGLTTGQVIVLN